MMSQSKYSVSLIDNCFFGSGYEILQHEIEVYSFLFIGRTSTPFILATKAFQHGHQASVCVQRATLQLMVEDESFGGPGMGSINQTQLAVELGHVVEKQNHMILNPVLFYVWLFGCCQLALVGLCVFHCFGLNWIMATLRFPALIRKKYQVLYTISNSKELI